MQMRVGQADRAWKEQNAPNRPTRTWTLDIGQLHSWGKGWAFRQNPPRRLDIHVGEKGNWTPAFHTHTQCVRDLRRKGNAFTEDTGHPFVLPEEQQSYNKMERARGLRERMKSDDTETGNVQDPTKKVKRHASAWKGIHSTYPKYLNAPKICKKKTPPQKRWAKDLNGLFIKTRESNYIITLCPMPACTYMWWETGYRWKWINYTYIQPPGWISQM